MVPLAVLGIVKLAGSIDRPLPAPVDDGAAICVQTEQPPMPAPAPAPAPPVRPQPAPVA